MRGVTVRLQPFILAVRAVGQWFGRLQVRLALVAVLLAIAFGLGDFSSAIQSRHQQIIAAQSSTANLSRSLAGQAHDKFLLLDTILIGLRERLENAGPMPLDAVRLRQFMALRVRALPMLHRLLVTDAEGRVVLSSEPGDPGGQDLSGTRLFRQHRQLASRDRLVGWSVGDARDDRTVLTVSRRLDGPGGSFAGVVVANVPVSFFTDIYRQFDLGKQGLVLLARDDASLMARWPTGPSTRNVDLSRGELFTRMVKPGDRAAFEYISWLDGLLRLGSYTRLDGMPLLVVVGRSKVDALASWRHDLVGRIIGFASVMLALVVVSRWLNRQIGRGEQVRVALSASNAQLAASEARIAAANGWLEMSEQVARVGHWHMTAGDTGETTWSDEVYRIFGVDKRVFEPTTENVFAAYHPDDRADLSNAVSHAMHTGESYEIEVRLIRPDGSLRHVSSRGLPQVNAKGKTTALFGVVMDISERKQNEQELTKAHAATEAANHALEIANHALERMAMQDALTGLANRRFFDRALDHEFRRAMRSGNSLALLMIDVDQFKPFNDTYGHQAGDACLRAIASQIPGLLKRPGDTAARYGGEELVVLLPGNTKEGALEIAARICDAVRDLQIEHAGSRHGMVTISVGVEALVPVHERNLASQLVEHADLALYAAKRAGRDCVRLFRALETSWQDERRPPSCRVDEGQNGCQSTG